MVNGDVKGCEVNNGFLAFLLHPREDMPLDNRPLSLFRTCCWYFGLCILMAVGLVILVTLDFSLDTGSDSTRHVPLWKMMLIPPFVEEFIFRLPLRRRRWMLTVWAGITAFMIVTFASGLKIYDVESLVWRLPVAMVVAGWMGWLGWKWMKKIPFGWLFYGLALMFGLLHLSNFVWGDAATTGTFAFLMLYSVDKVSAGLVLGYARVKHGFWMCVLLHMLNNLPFVV